MDSLPAFGKSIPQILQPTHNLFLPLLSANSTKINSVKKETFAYGQHERQQLDVYTPPSPSTVNGRRAVLMFAYGGGLIHGARSLPFMNNLMHANIGAFFALNAGYTVVVTDYRLMQHGAAFPSGGEDLALAVEWIIASYEDADLFLMGNSAGGVHLSTFLLHSSFAETRAKILPGGSSRSRLRGAVLLSVPLSFDIALTLRPELQQTVAKYFGDDVHGNSPVGLLRQAREKDGVLDVVNGGVRVLVLIGELDPEEDILIPRDEFVKEWSLFKGNPSRCALVTDCMEGQNHISPPCSLMTEGERENAWGWQVISFCDTSRKFQPRG
ncbi:Hypothetical protein R9X50_00064700 [Acrodontium crateriforme]|uniref:BD-FAE-like domain-containing protein n=1 Tax=Acrodontium crateriforme TaxID=150365 RepID=A0AAQ3M108_9PEZI|nr:Hypothetical protein R9X50_00064700 [Acrodontium crateriforme]